MKSFGGLKKILFLMFILPSVVICQSEGLDARDMNIPDLETSDKLAELPDSIQLDLSQLRLHYRAGAYEKAARLFYTRSVGSENGANQFGYLGIEPVSFSKPSESVYQRPVGWWGGNIYDAVKDHRESRKIMQAYRVKAITSDILFVSGVLAGLITVSGIFADVPFWGKNETDIFGQKGDCLEPERVNGQKTGVCIGDKYESQVGYNFAVTFTLLTSSIIPKLFNRGKVQKAVYIYNKQYQR